MPAMDERGSRRFPADSCFRLRLSHKSPGAKGRRQLSRSKDFWEGSETNQSPGNGSVWAAADTCDSLAYLRKSLSRMASCVRRLGLNPYEVGQKSASKIGSSTSLAAVCTILSRTGEMPRLLSFFPERLGISRSRVGSGR